MSSEDCFEQDVTIIGTIYNDDSKDYHEFIDKLIELAATYNYKVI